MSQFSANSTDYQALVKELGIMKELDKVLDEKQSYLNLLVQQRLAIEKGLNPFPLEQERSINRSASPSFLLTMQQGPILQEQDNQGVSSKSFSESSSSSKKSGSFKSASVSRDLKFPVKKDFDKSDFVNRNKALGPDARYYCTLTPKEQDRVEAILAAKEDDEETINVDTASEVTSYTLKSSSTAYTMDDESNERLQYIHKKLNEFLPHLDPSEDFWSTFDDSASKTTDSVDPNSADADFEKLKHGSTSPKRLTRNEINALALNCMKQHVPSQGRASPSAEL